MRQLSIALALAAVLALGNTALAQSPAAGEQAVSLGNMNFVMNPTERTNISDMQGEVIMVERWGVRCGPCVRYMPTLQQKWEHFGPEGLHVFALESQGSSNDDIINLLEPMGITFPVTSGVANGYNTGGGIPCCWIIDVNGEVVYAGNPYGLGDVLDNAMEEVLYPGLGRNDIHEDLANAARLFSRQDYAGARSEAQRVLERADRHEDQAVEDAQYIVDRVNGIVENMFARAEELVADRYYLEAVEMYERIEALFGREDEGRRASDAAREIERDRELRGELDAARTLRRLMRSLGERPEPEMELRALQQFLDRYERQYSETRAFQDAQERAEELESQLD